MEPAGGVYPDVVPEVVFVEVSEVDGDDVGDGMRSQRCFAVEAGDATGGKPVVFDICAGVSVGQAEHIRCAGHPEVKGKIADHPGDAGWVKSCDREVDAGGGIFAMNAGENELAPIQPACPAFDDPDARYAGNPQ